PPASERPRGPQIRAQKRHCGARDRRLSRRADGAGRVVLAWRGGAPAEANMDLDAKVCYCFHVTRRKLLSFIRVEKPRVASQLALCNGAGTGCGWCVPFLKKLFDGE